MCLKVRLSRCWERDDETFAPLSRFGLVFLVSLDALYTNFIHLMFLTTMTTLLTNEIRKETDKIRNTSLLACTII